MSDASSSNTSELQVSVVSWPDAGELAVGATEQHLLCLLSNTDLLIANGQGMHPYVQSYMARLDRLGHKYKRVMIDMSKVRAAYEASAARTVKVDHTPMQAQAKLLLSTACKRHASDIHIRVLKNMTVVYFRIHNDLNQISSHTREYGERMLATIYSAMTDISDSSYKPNERQDARIGDRDKLPEGLHGVRIATAPTVDGNVMVLRLLYDDTNASYDLCTLGFSEAHAKDLQLMKERPTGVHIISGPTGSGKSTTLQRLLAGQISENEQRLHVITVEDPPEYPIEGAVQTPVTNASGDHERGAAFSGAISNAMRLDPDTIMIGEMRDLASAQLCLRAAMTGHQVWTTLHANNTLSCIDRLADLGLPLALLADPTIVTGLVAQRLVQVLCPFCKKRLVDHRDELQENQYDRLLKAIGEKDKLEGLFLIGPGCPRCSGMGTTGRSVLAEVMIPDEELFQYMRQNQKAKAYEYWLGNGGVSMERHAVHRVIQGLVDPRLAERVVGHLPAAVHSTSQSHSSSHSASAKTSTVSSLQDIAPPSPSQRLDDSAKAQHVNN